MNKFSLAIMAGGKSSRMGTDKAFVTIMGKPLIEYLLSRLDQLGQAETFIITNQPNDYIYLQLPIYPDIIPEKGPLGGIYTALIYSQSLYTLVVACDTPFASPTLFKHMFNMTKNGDYDVIVPRVENYPQGLHAIYGKKCIEPIKKRLDADRLKVIGFYDEMCVRYIDEEEYQPIVENELSFYNINTPDDLEQVHKLLGSSRGKYE